MKYRVIYLWRGERHQVMPNNGKGYFDATEAKELVAALRFDRLNAWMEEL